MPGAPVEAPAANHPRLTAEAQTLESLSYCNLSKAKKEAGVLLYSKNPEDKTRQKAFRRPIVPCTGIRPANADLIKLNDRHHF
ncbi:hypothetical protein PG997_001431 [Apiospora hydei]|uniref:Uncharacterized protein n=1 Tax=Apiospora hydei TaxID=1337664 RepID=A0ABR1XDG8_9PEZI